MKIYYVEYLEGVKGETCVYPVYRRISPIFKTEEEAIQYAKK